MKTAAVISVGTEIMSGKIEDANSTYICKWLKDCGIKVKFRLSAEDVIDDIVRAIEYANSADIVVLTGGLGPTTDDITREALSKYLNKKLTFQEDEYQKISSFFQRYGRPMPVSNRKQAELIDGGEFLKNDNGTAPGMLCQENGKLLVLLPGPPRENQPMVQNFLLPKLKEKEFLEGEIYTKVYRIYDVGESVIADLFMSFNEDVEIGYYAVAGGWCEIHLSRYFAEKNKAKELTPILKKVEKILKDAGMFFTEDKDISLLVLETLKKKGLTLAVAESITGGNLSGQFVRNSGASKVLLGGVVAYSNDVKKKVLGVKQSSLTKYGAVSDQVAKEMALGVKKTTGADIAVSVTGIAGPEGGTKNKPVGLVHFGFSFGKKVYTKKEIIPGIRQRIMVRAVNMAFVEILKKLA
jgi:nicotinamide-nucleotide amidase